VTAPADAPRLLRTGHHPYEVALLWGSVGIGVVGLAVGLPPNPGPGRVVWLLTMIVGGVIALVGIRRTMTVDAISGLIVEQAGLVPLAVATGAYAAGMLTHGPREVWLDAILYGAATVAHAVRSWHIHRDIVHHRRVVERG
jgi:hypothetical protein